jgi:4-amino-4-deoxy-L-arabinose transferase-like glycosyltransferase
MEKGGFIKERKKIVIWSVFVFAIIINVYLYVHILNNFPHLLNDFESPYLKIAENLYEHGEYSFCNTEDCVPVTSVLPVAPIIGYLVFLICGVGNTALEVIRIILMLSNFGIIIVTYYIGKMFNYKIGAAAAFLAAADVSMFCWSNNFKADMIYAFLFTMSIYFLVKFVKFKQSKKSIISASVFLGLAVITKAGLQILLCPIAGFLLVFLLFIKKKSFIKSLYYVGLFVVIQLVFIMGWQMRNYHATGVMAFSSNVGGIVLFEKHIPFIIAYQEGISNDEAQERVRKKYATEDIMKLDATARSEYYKKVAFSIVLGSPLDYAIVLVKSSAQLFLGTAPPDFLFSKQKREELFEVLQVKLYNYNVKDDKSSLPMLSKRVPKYMGPLSSFPLLKKLWNSNKYSYIFLWSIIKAHVLLIYLMAIIGCFIILRGKSDRRVLVLMVLIIIFYVPVLGPATASRHRAVLMPVFYFLSSYGLVWVGEVLQKYKK